MKLNITNKIKQDDGHRDNKKNKYKMKRHFCLKLEYGCNCICNHFRYSGEKLSKSKWIKFINDFLENRTSSVFFATNTGIVDSLIAGYQRIASPLLPI